MKILITNDDGIYAEGMLPFVQWACTKGEVTVAAPKFEQSGKSHGIELHRAFEAKEIDLLPGVRAYSIDSTPADCVRYMVLGRKEKFDLVLSGINRGFNVGTDIMYSGTVGAVFEAVALGIPAIAVSTSRLYYPGAVEQMDKVFDFIEEKKLLQRHCTYNINIPLEPKGFRFTRQGGPYFSDDFVHQGEDMYLPTGRFIYRDTENLELDSDAVTHGWISVMPLSIQRADMALYEQLCKEQ